MLSKLLALFCLALNLPGQTCAHQVKRSPVGPVLVYRNGILQRLTTDYLYLPKAGSFPSIDPVTFAVGDTWAVVFSRAVPLTSTAQGVILPYWGYQLWQETWACSTGNVSLPSTIVFLAGLESAPPVCPLTGLAFFFATDSGHFFWCSAAGDSIWHNVGDVRNGAQVLGIETCNGFGVSGIDGIGWNCAGLYHASIGLSDGSILSLIGPNMLVPGLPLATWIPVK